MAEIYTIDPAAYAQEFGEGPHVGHYLVEADRAGAVVAVIDCYTVKVAWHPRRARTAKRRRKTTHHMDTPQKYVMARILAQDALDAAHAAYGGV